MERQIIKSNKLFGFVFVLPIILGSFLFFGAGHAFAATKTVCASGCDYTTLAAAESGAATGDTINVSTGTYNANNPTFTKGLNWVAIDGIGTVVITNSVAGGNYAAAFTGTATATTTGFIFDALSDDKAMSLITGSNKTFIDCTFRNTLTGGYPGIQFTGTNDANTFIRPTVATTGTDFVNNLFDMTAGTTTNTTISYPTVTATIYTYVIGSHATNTGTLTVGNGSASSGGTWTITTVTGRQATVRFLGNNLSGDVSVNNATINFVGAVGNAGIIALSTDGTAGSFTWTNNSVSSVAAGANNLIYMTKTAHTISITGGSISYPAGWGNYAAIYISDQVSPVIDGIVLTNGDTGTGGDHITITASSNSKCGINCGTIQVKNNVIYTKTTGAVHTIMVGSDASTAGNNMLDGALITGNRIYGPSYYDTAINSLSIHGILYGYNKNGTIKGNYVDGFGFGIVAKGAGDTWASGGYFNNVVKNSLQAANFMVKGQNNIPIYNNVLYNNATVNASFFGLLNVKNNDDGNYSTGAMVKNNVFLGIASKDLIQFDSNATGFVTSNNGYYTSTGLNPSWHVGATVFSVFSGTGSWQAADRDISPSFFSDPFLTSSSNFNLLSASPAIDSGTNVSISSDYSGNSIYGSPDIGAYEYQPPFTFAANDIPVTGSVRLYSDGKYRMITASSTAEVANFSVAPAGGAYYTASTSQYMDITIDSWQTTGSKNKQWTATSSSGQFNTHATSTVYTIGDLVPLTYYQFKLDNSASTTAIAGYGTTICTNGLCQADSSGNLSFTYIGGYSTHAFALEKEIAPPVSTPSLSGATYANAQSIILTCADAGSGCDKIYYTIDGSTPTAGSQTYAAPITITNGYTSLKFFATDLNGNQEAIHTENYTIITGSVAIFTSPLTNITTPAQAPTNSPQPSLVREGETIKSPNPPLLKAEVATMEQIQREALRLTQGRPTEILPNFIANGTPTTLTIGSGERQGVINSFKSAFGKPPQSEADWSDVLKIANGRWPSQRDKATETNAEPAFKKIYQRNPARTSPKDDAAVTVMAYGLRPAQRNLNSEKNAIKIFRAIYGYAPKSAMAWDIVRAIAYSGARR